MEEWKTNLNYLQENANSPVVNNPIVENTSLTGFQDFINGVSKDERRGRQFRGTQVIRVFSGYQRFDVAFSTSTAGPGGGG